MKIVSSFEPNIVVPAVFVVLLSKGEIELGKSAAVFGIPIDVLLEGHPPRGVIVPLPPPPPQFPPPPGGGAEGTMSMTPLWLWWLGGMLPFESSI